MVAKQVTYFKLKPNRLLSQLSYEPISTSNVLNYYIWRF